MPFPFRTFLGKYIPAACFLSLFPYIASAADQDRRSFGHSDSLGVNYPGAGLKLHLSDRFAAELRGQYEDRVFTAGARMYYYPAVSGFADDRVRSFLGLEGGHVTFKGRYSKGQGAALGAFGGAEYFLSRRVSVQTDAGPYYILLKDRHTAIKQRGLEFVLNFGINFYFK